MEGVYRRLPWERDLTFFMRNVNGGQGFYTCMAPNDYGSEISSPAELKVQGTISF